MPFPLFRDSKRPYLEHMPRHRYTYLFLPVLALWTCKPTADPYAGPADGTDYYPLEVGSVHEFYLDSILFDTVPGQRLVDTIRLEVREQITDTFHDQSGRLWYRYQRYERPRDSNAPWQARLTGARLLDGTQLVEREKGFDLMLLTFPLSQNASWNPTVYIDPETTVSVRGEPVKVFKNWLARVEALDRPDTIGNNAWPQTARIRLADETNLIERRHAVDVYARQLGLVYRRREILDSQNLDPDAPWPHKAQKGFILVMWRK